MIGRNMNWNIVDIYSRQNNLNNQASGDPSAELYVKSEGKLIPKPRSKFTMSQSVLENATNPTWEVDDDMAIQPPSSDLSFGIGSFSPTLLIQGKRSHHGSMENLHKPKNHRSDHRFQEVSEKMKETSDMNGRLIQENIGLIKSVEDLKKKAVALKVTGAFSYQAFQGQRFQNESLKADLHRKEEECAARMILQKLLLNSWRNSKAELESLLQDNTELNDTVENLSLQLRVVRHLQSVEKEKALEKTEEIERLNTEVFLLKQDNENNNLDMERMESELNSLQENIQNLQEQNKQFETSAKILTEENISFEKSLDLEKAKTEELENLHERVKSEASCLEKQLTEITGKNNQWQERARTLESESWQLKMDIESRNKTIDEMKDVCDELQEEKDKLIQMKANLKGQLNETTEKLEQASFNQDELILSLQEAEQNMKDQGEKIECLESSLKKTKNEYTEVEKELLTYKLQNVKRRREWVNALYFIVNPMDAIRRSFTTRGHNLSINRKSMQ